MKPLLLALTFLLGLSLPAQAQDSHVLLTHKAWTVTLQISEDGDMYCQAETINRRGDSFTITAQPNAIMLFLFLAGNHWNGAFTDDLQLDIDYKPWTLYDAEFIDDGVFDWVVFTFPGGEEFKRFIDNLFEGNAVALKNPARSHSLATWSLAGSAASLMKLGECLSRLDAAPATGAGYGSSY